MYAFFFVDLFRRVWWSGHFAVGVGHCAETKCWSCAFTILKSWGRSRNLYMTVSYCSRLPQQKRRFAALVRQKEERKTLKTSHITRTEATRVVVSQSKRLVNPDHRPRSLPSEKQSERYGAFTPPGST